MKARKLEVKSLRRIKIALERVKFIPTMIFSSM
jgi:hypothetical protein